MSTENIYDIPYESSIDLTQVITVNPMKKKLMLAYIENESKKYKNLSNLNFSQDNEELLEYISQLFDLLSKNNHDIELKNLVKIQNNLTKLISKLEVKKSKKRKNKSVCKCFGA
jgi:hypothetical protein